MNLKQQDHLSNDEDADMLDQRKKKKRKHKHHKHKKDKSFEKDASKSDRKKHKKHKRTKKDREAENGTTEEKPSAPTRIVIVTPKESVINGKVGVPLEVVSTEESEDEKLVDLDSDEVDCTIIEDDIDLEELMKQKVGLSIRSQVIISNYS